MSGILAVFDRGAPSTPRPTFARMLEMMHARGADHAEVCHTECAALGVVRYSWEWEGKAGETLVLDHDDIMVAADASIYYRADLQRKLRTRGVVVSGDSPAHLILAAYRAWGERCIDHLEGDFGFVVWDKLRRRCYAARDFAGKRPLFLADLDGTLIIASSMGAILQHPAVSDAMSTLGLAEAAAGVATAADATCYDAIRALPAGFALTWSPAERLRSRRFWEPRVRSDESKSTFADAAEELRELLSRAIVERLDPAGPTSVQLSGGWDSTAIYALAQHHLRQSGARDGVRAVSISYPLGDPGREDEIVDLVLEHWNAKGRWLDIAAISMFGDDASRAANRDEPFGHPYEAWNRALQRAGREEGTRIMLDGYGGDQLFGVSNVYFADLLRRGRLRALRQELRAKKMVGLRPFFQYAVKPLVAGAAYWDRPIAPWIDETIASQLLERRSRAIPEPVKMSRADFEMHRYLLHPFYTRIVSLNSAFGLEEGVELRSPLFDQRVVEFAATRPRSERSSGRQTKRLLRKSVEGLLPERVLAPRRYRTGTTSGYFRSSMTSGFPQLAAQVFRDSVLARRGIIDPAGLQAALDRYAVSKDANLGGSLLFTLYTELWMQARARVVQPHASPVHYAAAAGSSGW